MQDHEHLGDDFSDFHHADISTSEIARWLDERLAAERALLELRHRAICESLLRGKLEPALKARVAESMPDVSGFASSTPTETSASAQSSPTHVSKKVQGPETSQHAFNAHKRASTPHREESFKQFRDRLRRTLRPGSGVWWLKEIKSKETPKQEPSKLARFVRGNKFELFFGVLIVFNTLVMALEAEHFGLQLADNMAGGRDAQIVWPGADTVFRIFELLFGIVFALEVVIKVCVTRLRFCRSGWNLFDAALVLMWCVQVATLGKREAIINPYLLRIVRLVRVLRMVRLVRMVELFDTLGLLLGSLKAAVPVFIWSTTLLVAILTMWAIGLHSALQPYMTGTDPKSQEVYMLFGTYSRSMLSMFELTLGNWVPITRLLHEHVNAWWGPILLFYKISVGFSVIRVISGVFMHETFRCASMDDELMIQSRTRAQQRFRRKMQALFKAAASSDSGIVTCEEFVHVVGDPRVLHWLQAMEIPVRDPMQLFHYLSHNQELTFEGLVKGMQRLRGHAQAADIVGLLAEIINVKQAVAAQASARTPSTMSSPSRLLVGRRSDPDRLSE